jgi:hypothetical protein
MVKARLNALLWKRARWLMVKRQLLSNNTVLENREFLETYLQILSEGRAFLTLRDMYNLYYHVTQTAERGANTAELGVYRGGSAKLIARFKGNRPLHLFDTFRGLPSAKPEADNFHQPGDFSATSETDVMKYLHDSEGVFLHPGLFPESLAATQLHQETFSFVHLDADIYESTLAGLRFFYPRLVKGGTLISHDYSAQTCRGVRLAFQEYFAKDPGLIVPLWDSQVLVIKPS